MTKKIAAFLKCHLRFLIPASVAVFLLTDKMVQSHQHTQEIDLSVYGHAWNSDSNFQEKINGAAFE